MRQRRRRAAVFLAICSCCILITAPAAPAGAAAGPYPPTSAAACNSYPGGAFHRADGVSECTVNHHSGTTIYAGFGDAGFDWVQTSFYTAGDPPAGVELGPASVACRRPAPPVPEGWAARCL